MLDVRVKEDRQRMMQWHLLSIPSVLTLVPRSGYYNGLSVLPWDGGGLYWTTALTSTRIPSSGISKASRTSLVLSALSEQIRGAKTMAQSEASLPGCPHQNPFFTLAHVPQGHYWGRRRHFVTSLIPPQTTSSKLNVQFVYWLHLFSLFRDKVY